MLIISFLNLYFKRHFLDKISDYPFFRFVLMVFLFSLIISLAFQSVFYFAGLKDVLLSDKPSIAGENIYFQSIKLVIILPIIETLIFQLFPYFLMTQFDYLKNRSWIIIILSAILFGLSHYYSLWYILHSGSLGALFMYAYIVRQRKNDSFAALCLVHILRNVTSFTMELWTLYNP